LYFVTKKVVLEFVFIAFSCTASLYIAIKMIQRRIEFGKQVGGGRMRRTQRSTTIG
jgi:hypothetical protein